MSMDYHLEILTLLQYFWFSARIIACTKSCRNLLGASFTLSFMTASVNIQGKGQVLWGGVDQVLLGGSRPPGSLKMPLDNSSLLWTAGCILGASGVAFGYRHG